MTKEDRELFCTIAATLMTPADEVVLADLSQEGLRSFLMDCFGRREGRSAMLRTLFDHVDRGGLEGLQEAYDRLFGLTGDRQVSLVESTYKPWTGDNRCGMVFANSGGLIMGDAAVHLLDLYDGLSLDLPDRYRSTPDHLVVELEFLALLYRDGTIEQGRVFIEDHLDWVPDLREAAAEGDPDSFYTQAIALIDLFLQDEKRNRRGHGHGTKNIH